MIKRDFMVELEKINSRNDLSKFVQALSEDCKENSAEWENPDLTSFLAAMASWIQDMDGYYSNHNKPFSEDQSWKTFAEIVFAAKQYE